MAHLPTALPCRVGVGSGGPGVSLLEQGKCWVWWAWCQFTEAGQMLGLVGLVSVYRGCLALQGKLFTTFLSLTEGHPQVFPSENRLHIHLAPSNPDFNHLTDFTLAIQFKLSKLKSKRTKSCLKHRGNRDIPCWLL